MYNVQSNRKLFPLFEFSFNERVFEERIKRINGRITVLRLRETSL